jgi:hypothetical protein
VYFMNSLVGCVVISLELLDDLSTLVCRSFDIIP